ncbi:TonB family protein [Sphingomonas edaphi]|nr:TonB family protein [Sphingomonas edaphi]
MRPAAPPAAEKPSPPVLLDINPPPPPPPPRSEPGRAREEEGAAGKKAEPTPVVAPRPVIPVPVKPTVAAAPVPGTGSSPNAGASTAGSGTGAGGSGSGRGGGGSGGGFEGYTPARLIENVRRSDYRALTAGRLSSGAAMVSLRVDTAGRATNCRVVRSSGDPTVDGGLCPLLARRLRFQPATDNFARPIPYSLEYVATWRL